jgi:hypothetical protein
MLLLNDRPPHQLKHTISYSIRPTRAYDRCTSPNIPTSRGPSVWFRPNHISGYSGPLCASIYIFLYHIVMEDQAFAPLLPPRFSIENYDASITSAPTFITSSSISPTATKWLTHGSFYDNLHRNISMRKHHSDFMHSNDPKKWRVPTILALTIAIALGTALAVFLAFIAYRRVKKLRDLQRRAAEMRMVGS